MRRLVLSVAAVLVMMAPAFGCVLEFGQHQGEIVHGRFLGCTYKEYRAVLREFLENTNGVELLQRTEIASGMAEPSYFLIDVRDPKKQISAR